ncbi:hypothetical protein KOW79_001011 [Hemibagrus wyckioides]|uniref:G-protein coupled receptors family 1 profile domain-containing protein n=1 Tax=Hemibagrus wyckioides TaxID=337641 RepID=A0A9D3SZ70_9TELE|nr:hypothetical protein KOW79_001011 [Hemibagrus wyckioides]
MILKTSLVLCVLICAQNATHHSEHLSVVACNMDMLDTSTMVDFEDENSSMTYMPPCDLFDISNFSRHLLPPFYYAIFIISLLGNGLVLYILFKFEKINTVTNVFLINLVASDLIFTLGLPFQAVYHSSEWSFGQVGCKVMNGTYHLGFYSSVLFLTLLTFDRYLAVVHAVAAVKWRQSCYAYFSAMVVWIVSGLTSLETFLNHDVTDDIVQGLTCTDMATWCSENHQDIFYHVLLKATAVRLLSSLLPRVTFSYADGAACQNNCRVLWMH